MRRLRPGGVAWLLRNELRLTLRGLGRGGAGPLRVLIGLGVAFAVLAILAGVPLGLLARAEPRGAPSPPVAAALDWGLLVVLALMLSQALAAATDALFTRGDLDLLLSSPLDGRKVLVVRGVAIAARPFLIYGGLALAVVGPVAIMGRPQFLAVLVLLAGLAMLATAAGVGLALGLFALIGPRATRTLGQVLAAVIGGSVFLLGQAGRFGGRGGMWTLLRGWATPERFGEGSPLSWPARAAFGAPGPLLGLVLACTAVFALTLAGLGRRFAADAAVSAGVAQGRAGGRSRRRSRARVSRSALRAIVRKELRLFLHDPSLLSQVGLRVIYLVPLCYVLVRTARLGGGALAPAVALVSVVAAQVAGSLAWITVSAEDAPDLLLSSPVGAGRIRQAKLLAALLPLALIMIVPLAGLAVLAPWAGLVATVGVAASSVSAGLVNLWFEKPASRSNFRRRGGSILTSMAEIALGISWGAACALAVAGLPWAAAPILLSLALLLVFWRLRRPALAY